MGTAVGKSLANLGGLYLDKHGRVVPEPHVQELTRPGIVGGNQLEDAVLPGRADDRGW